MTEDDKRVDAELEALERRSEQIEDDISDTRKEWERKQADAAVPGAVGEPEAKLPPPEPDETD
jgi:hypothetical protein